MKNNLTLSTLGTLLVLALSISPAEGAQAPRTYLLRSGRKPGDVDRVVARLEVGGELKEVVDEKVQRIKMHVGCDFSYDEKTLDVPTAAVNCWRSVRDYDKLDATVNVEGEVVKPALRPERRLIGVQFEPPQATLFSPQGTLTRDELELIDVLANSLLLDHLLPEKPLAISQSWKIPDEVTTALLGLDAVGQSDVQSVLKEVTDAVARMELSGRVEGTLDGAPTQIDLKAKYRFDLARKRIDWLGLLVKEQRGVGQVKRGVDAVAQLQLRISPRADSARLTDAALENLPLKPTSGLGQLTCASTEGGWQMTHERSWHVIGENRELTILRRLDRGELIAQCNISALPKLPPGKEITLADFQEDVQKALGQSFAGFVEAGQSANDADYRVYRVVAQSEVSQVPICWHYYLVADEHGRQVALAFTVEQKLLERFGKADEELIRSFGFADPKPASAAQTSAGR